MFAPGICTMLRHSLWTLPCGVRTGHASARFAADRSDGSASDPTRPSRRLDASARAGVDTYFGRG